MSKDTVEYNGKQGVWRTISGRKVFIAEGESLSEAMRKSGKFKGTEFGSRTERNKGLYERLAKRVRGNKKDTKPKEIKQEETTRDYDKLSPNEIYEAGMKLESSMATDLETIKIGRAHV